MSDYAFEGDKVKINQKDFNKMQKLYQNLNLAAELEQLDFELKDKRSWWSELNAKLNYRNRCAPKRNVAVNEGNVSHLNRSTRQMTLEQEFSSDWAK